MSTIKHGTKVTGQIYGLVDTDIFEVMMTTAILITGSAEDMSNQLRAMT